MRQRAESMKKAMAAKGKPKTRFDDSDDNESSDDDDDDEDDFKIKRPAGRSTTTAPPQKAQVKAEPPK